jgi:L-fuconolactonase
MKRLVIDAHQHYWELGRFEYFWMTPEREALRRNFLPEHLVQPLRHSGVDHTIAVQAYASHEESFWLLEVSSAFEFVAGVVAWTDLTSTNLGKALDEFQRHQKFKGIRHPLEAEPDDGWVVRPQVQQGLAELDR